MMDSPQSNRAANWPERCLLAYAGLTPTARGGFRLVRAVRGLCGGGGMRSFELPSGPRMRLDLDAYPDCTMAFGLYEVETVRAVRGLLRPGDLFVDAGANVGYFSLLAAQCVGPAGRVHAFEPYPPNRSRLNENVQANGFADVIRVHAQALSDCSGESVMHLYTSEQANHGQATAFPQPGQDARQVRVATTTLDEALPDVSPRLIKLDIEGSELRALRGMEQAIRRSGCSVIVECNPDTFRNAGTSAMQIASLLRDFLPGHECRALRWPVRRIDPLPATLEKLGEFNLLFTPSPRRERGA
jgi:FkbM family methyltransferase